LLKFSANRWRQFIFGLGRDLNHFSSLCNLYCTDQEAIGLKRTRSPPHLFMVSGFDSGQNSVQQRTGVCEVDLKRILVEFRPRPYIVPPEIYERGIAKMLSLFWDDEQMIYWRSRKMI
jgi:hypothetical protein